MTITAIAMMSSVMVRSGKAVTNVANNVANIQSIGAKEYVNEFYSETSGAETGGGSSYQSGMRVAKQGRLERTGVSTNFAVKGEGMVPIEGGLTRVTNFRVDKNGDVVNGNNEKLLVKDLQKPGDVTSLSDLSTFNVNNVTGSANATTKVMVSNNLPAAAVVGVLPNIKTPLTIYDTLGIDHKIEISWEKTGVNAWKAHIKVDDKVDAVVIPLTFKDGKLLQTNGADTGDFDATLDFSATGANAAQKVTFNFGTPNTSSGVSQFDRTFVAGDSKQVGGRSYGSFKDIYIDEFGVGHVMYNNGTSEPRFQIHLVHVGNYDKLEQTSGGSFQMSIDSGDISVRKPGQGVGTIAGGYIEMSTVELTEQLRDLMMQQQVNGAAVGVTNKAADMLDRQLRILS